VGLAAGACAGDIITSPAGCPPYCTGVEIQSLDTLLPAAVHRDSTFRGYETASSARTLQATGTGSVAESRIVMKFFPFGDRVQINAGDTTTGPIIQTDSFRLELLPQGRTPDDVRIALYRLPSDLSADATFEQLTPWFQDSTRVGEFAISPDDEGVARLFFPASAIPAAAGDTFTVALGIGIASPATGALVLGSSEGGSGGFLARYVRVDSVPDVPVTRADGRLPQFDTFVFPALPAVSPGVLAVGGAPAARTFLGLSVPSRIVDSSNVVRATLLLVPAGPVLSAPGDTLRVMAHTLAADFGPKSPVAVTAADTVPLAGAFIPPGASDTIRIDVTSVLRVWRADTTLPRVLVLRSVPEAGGFGELRFWSTADATRGPALDITYVPPVGFGAP
jgi:hypothetical protein